MGEQLTIDWEAAAGKPDLAPEQIPDAKPDPRAQSSEMLAESQAPVRQVALPYLPGKPHRGAFRRKVEQFFRDKNVPYVNVDESKKALFAGAPSWERFISFPTTRLVPTGWSWAAQMRKVARKNMLEWERVFGEGFLAVVAKERSTGESIFKKLNEWRGGRNFAIKVIDRIADLVKCCRAGCSPSATSSPHRHLMWTIRFRHERDDGC